MVFKYFSSWYLQQPAPKAATVFAQVRGKELPNILCHVFSFIYLRWGRVRYIRGPCLSARKSYCFVYGLLASVDASTSLVAAQAPLCYSTNFLPQLTLLISCFGSHKSPGAVVLDTNALFLALGVAILAVGAVLQVVRATFGCFPSSIGYTVWVPFKSKDLHMAHFLSSINWHVESLHLAFLAFAIMPGHPTWLLIQLLGSVFHHLILLLAIQFGRVWIDIYVPKLLSSMEEFKSYGLPSFLTWRWI